MERPTYFLRLYEVYHEELLGQDDNSLRPAKSITRNIFSSVDAFIRYYQSNHLISFTVDDVHCNILRRPRESNPDRTTAKDNIRNMVELKFMTYDNNTCQLTDNFVKFCESEIPLKDYLLAQLGNISSITDISMFFNYILCTLKEGLLTPGFFITYYPESANEFIRAIPDFEIRKKLCKKVFEIYGFNSNNKPYGTYTPNCNYRIVSTCKNLGLIEPCDEPNRYNFRQYRLTNEGLSLILKINRNLKINHALEDDGNSLDVINAIEKASGTRIHIDSGHNARSNYRDEDDARYQNEVEDTEPDRHLSIRDLPKAKPNNLRVSRNQTPYRDPKVAANAKKRAEYRCEYNCEHTTFNDRKGRNYCEAHHLIPMAVQNLDRFRYSLDVEANVISLCPICHARLHHSNDETRDAILKKLYESRKGRLHNCGIDITIDELINIYNDETIKK